MRAFLKKSLLLFLLLQSAASAANFDKLVADLLGTNEFKRDSAVEILDEYAIPKDRPDLFAKIIHAIETSSDLDVRSTALTTLYAQSVFYGAHTAFPPDSEKTFQRILRSLNADAGDVELTKEPLIYFLLASPLKDAASVDLLLDFYEECIRNFDRQIEKHSDFNNWLVTHEMMDKESLKHSRTLDNSFIGALPKADIFLERFHHEKTLFNGLSALQKERTQKILDFIEEKRPAGLKKCSEYIKQN